jgi:hypothetical protein
MGSSPPPPPTTEQFGFYFTLAIYHFRVVEEVVQHQRVACSIIDAALSSLSDVNLTDAVATQYAARQTITVTKPYSIERIGTFLSVEQENA